MSNAASENVFPLVTDCDVDNDPAARRRLFVSSTIAQLVAVPVAVTVPDEIAATVTLRPLGVRAPGAPIPPDRKSVV